ncbi:MAG: reductive dehalogenase [Rhodospirillaceae bacterium]|jgi:reductive dehalogenase|nr:reductive dehalogenase [Rhodospirillaceae bacterium]MBT4114977.1 reductive dehalogenase [Rhodospirillaceae bacterium]MBT4718908.1 reductive dehalogenase [Rhodospirillaceae bacterium]MBT5177650.1 reductive dehalogenase [Rhodospirillaceae bacterium]MBT5839295.1 reductive dehalogenase [Rhodospirillaceae bacterium]
MSQSGEDHNEVANWPSNHPPGDWARFAKSDAAAGFEIGPDFKRFSQHDDAFNRAWWDEAIMSPAVRTFYEAQLNPKPRKAEGFGQWDYALINSAWSVARDYAARGRPDGRREGFVDAFQSFLPQSETQAELPSTEETTARIKQVAKFLGAGKVGITEYDERWVYTHSAEVNGSRDERPNELAGNFKSVIVLAHEMDYELVKSYPSATAAAATGREYSREAAIVSSLASFIRALGYEAVGSSNDSAITIPYAIKAGMGEYGRNQMVITEEFGPRVRFSKVFTELELVYDAPKKFGARQTCDVCTKCADACPPKALPHGPPQAVGPNRSNITGVTKWSADCEKCFTYWTKINVDCAICMRVCPYNKDYSKWKWRAMRRLLGTPLRGLMLWLDDRMGFGKRRKPLEWWRRSMTE